MPIPSKSLADVKKALREKSVTAKATFGTSHGEKMLKLLEDEFNSDNIMAPNDPFATHYNLGRRDVVIYIKQLMRVDSDENS